MGTTRWWPYSSSRLFQLLPLLLLQVLNLGQRTSCVIMYNISLLTESNRTDYVLHGESATLFCNYEIAQEETVSSVRWEWKTRGSEESTEVYIWRPSRRPMTKGILVGRADSSNTKPGFIVIRQADMEMEGRYTCFVQTNQKTAHTEFSLIVIVDACKESVWHTKLDVDNCTETIHMHCVGIFPKPSASCGVFNEVSNHFLTSVPFDRVITLRNSTYEVFLKQFYNVRNWSNYTNITFQCYFVIDGTSWKRGIRHRLFGPLGCPSSPPSPGLGSYNMSEEKSCWGHAREGALAHYSCNSSARLKGPETTVCRDGSWVPESPFWDGPRTPICNTADKNALCLAFHVILLFWSALFTIL